MGIPIHTTSGPAYTSYIVEDGITYTAGEYANLTRDRLLKEHLDRIEAKLDQLLGYGVPGQ